MNRFLERYERSIIRPLRRAKAHDYLVAQAVDESRSWRAIQDAIALSGDPTMLTGGIAGLELTPSIKDLPTVTGSATEQAMWPVANTPIGAAPRAPTLWRVFAFGTSTTAAAPGTYTMALRLGNANTSPLFGAVSGALTPVASATAAHWRAFGVVFLRGGDTTGTAAGSFEMNHSGTIGGGGPVTATGNAIFGGISASVDFSLTTNGIWVGVTHATSTTNTWVPQFVGHGTWS